MAWASYFMHARILNIKHLTLTGGQIQATSLTQNFTIYGSTKGALLFETQNSTMSCFQ